MKKPIAAIMALVLMFGALGITASAAEGVNALSADITFECNAVPLNIETYNISDFGFYKLRDIAAMCDGTEKEFSVAWDGEKEMITLVSGGDYNVLASDLQPGGGGTQIAYASDVSVIINGEQVALTVYNINGFTYYKLRELCKALDIYVSWNEETRTSGIDTTKGYEWKAPETETEPAVPEDDGFTAEDFANAKPRTREEFYELMCYMKANGINSFTENVEGVHLTGNQFQNELDNLIDCFHYAYGESAEDYLYHMTFFEGISWNYRYWYDGYGAVYRYTYTVSFTLRDGLSESETMRRIGIFEDECAKIIDTLRAEGKLSDAMTDREKAQVLYEYIDHRFQYDDNYFDVPAYDAIMNDRAVCEGYTAIYNYLCKLVGVNAKARFGASGIEAHVWTEIESGGQIYTVDVTWGDPRPDRGPNYSNLSYFWISEHDLVRLDPFRIFYESMPWE